MIVMVTGVKGGSGKSTTAVNLAVMRARQGHTVLLYDTDKQLSAAGWGEQRQADGLLPRIPFEQRYMQATDLREIQVKGRAMLADLNEKRQHYETVIVDASGADNPALRYALTLADQVLIPVAPSQFDLWAFNKFHEILLQVLPARSTETIPLVFASNVSPHDRDEDAQATLADAYDGYRFLNVTLGQRKVFRHAIREGRGVVEMEYGGGRKRDPKACAELRALYKAVFAEEYRDVCAQ